MFCSTAMRHEVCDRLKTSRVKIVYLQEHESRYVTPGKYSESHAKCARTAASHRTSPGVSQTEAEMPPSLDAALVEDIFQSIWTIL